MDARRPDDARRAVPRTDTVLADSRLAAAIDRLGRDRVKAVVVTTLRDVREGRLAPDDAADAAVAALPTAPTAMTAVLNATGVVLHTNLGRAPLSRAAREAVATAAGYTDVEFDLGTGQRARRGRSALAALAAAVPAAGGVHVVNNGAAALVLATTALGAGREVVVSRGEMVEIGDGFRLPDLIESTGARLREVGTTNRVRLADYRAAIGPTTGAVLKVHPSNFRIEGFTSSVPVRELATLGVPVIADVGSGLLRPHALLSDEPDVTSSLTEGAHLVTCSGDKLLGGPQAGLVFGTAELVEQVRRHPLSRALRVDKLTLAALEASVLGPRTPTWDALTPDADTLRARTAALAATLSGDLVESHGAVGGGGGTGVPLPGWAVALEPDLAAPLRRGTPPVVGRVAHDRLLLDLRCVEPVDDARVAEAVRTARERLRAGTAHDR